MSPRPPHRLEGQGLDPGPEGCRRQACAVQPPEQPLHRAGPQLSHRSTTTGKIPKACRVSAMIFGGRRATTMPLIFQAFNWIHGVYLGATMGSEMTAAAAGALGQVRRDPMAMLPFCGYNMGDYFAHWLEMRGKVKHSPRIFHVNWFRKRRGGQIPLAWFRRKHARAEVDRAALWIWRPRSRDFHWLGASIRGSRHEGSGWRDHRRHSPTTCRKSTLRNGSASCSCRTNCSSSSTRAFRRNSFFSVSFSFPGCRPAP